MAKTHTQTALYVQTHKLIEEIIDAEQDDSKPGKVSKASLIHDLVEKHHKKVVKSGNK